MTLFRGVEFPSAGHSGGDTVDNDFGPLDIGPGGRDGDGGSQLKFGGEDGTNMWCYKLER